MKYKNGGNSSYISRLVTDCAKAILVPGIQLLDQFSKAPTLENFSAAALPFEAGFGGALEDAVGRTAVGF